jgi:hypothetical protein
MKTDVEAWKERLSSLEPGERAELARLLFESLEPEEEGAEAEWDEVAAERIREIHGDRAKGPETGEFLPELSQCYP